ncbi:MAG: DmsC/YnfH family molybdoenzyme membrane anchor subunit, partial [Verrucomicrobiota bacterium]
FGGGGWGGGGGVGWGGLGFWVLGWGGSVLHLGRPGQGWKAFLGWRRSWLSREVIAFGAWAPVAGAFAGAMWLGLSDWVVGPLGLLTGALGVTGVWCSVMVYVDTRRPAWCIGLTAMKFFGTVGIGYFAAMGMSLGVMGMVLVKMGVEARMLTAGGDEAFGRVSALQWGPLRGVVLVRAACGLSGALLMGLGLSFYGGLALVIVGELLERVLFFRSAAAPKMPGTI